MKDSPTVLILGATGGTGLSILRLCLAKSYKCTAMVRNPEKLLSLLSLSEAPPNLTITTGTIQDITAIQRALLTSEGKLVDVVISCVGFVPSLKPGSRSLNMFKNIDDLHICEEATRNILSAISDIKSGLSKELGLGGKEDNGQAIQNPLLVVLSTTGISPAGRDIPLLMTPLYYGLLGPPHEDKKAMEDMLRSTTYSPWIAVRPSFLSGDGKGEHSSKNIRVGTEKDGKVEKRAIGYTISREDVGYWIFNEILQSDWMKWAGRAVSLTH